MVVINQVHSVMTRCNKELKGFALIEVIIAITIVAISSNIAFVGYNYHLESIKTAKAVNQIVLLANILDRYSYINKHYPDSLDDIGMSDLLDPWNNPYQYNIAEDPCADVSRKDHNTNSINTDYDLYSMGKDGASVPILSAKSSRDDIIRANNGNYIGMAIKY